MKKNITFIFFFYLFSQIINGENSRWNIGLQAGMNTSGVRFIPINLADSNSYYDFTFFKEKSIPKYGLVMGIDLNYQLTNKFSLESGVQYLNTGYQIPWQPWPSFRDPDYIDWKSIIEFHYLQIPVLFKIKIWGNLSQFWVGGGFAPSILLKNYYINYKRNLKGTKVHDNSAHEYSSQIVLFGCAVSEFLFTISNRLQLGVKLGLNYALNSNNNPTKGTVYRSPDNYEIHLYSFASLINLIYTL